jgi:chloride channel 3/4/5
LTDAGLLIVSPDGWLRGYITQTELEYALGQLGGYTGETMARLLAGEGGEDISVFVDRMPIMLTKDTPVEVVARGFGKISVRYVCIIEDGRGVGVVIKKRFLMFMEEMAGGH